MELHINYQKFFDQDHSFVSFPDCDKDFCYVEFGDDFRPGVWAGTEGLVLDAFDYKIKITKVDFENKRLECNKIYGC